MQEMNEGFGDNMGHSMVTKVMLFFNTKIDDFPSGGLQLLCGYVYAFCDKGFCIACFIVHIF